MLEAGEFDKNNDDYKQYLIGKKKREQPVEEWKVKYYEEYWGQKKKTQSEEETVPLTLYSFTENNTNPPLEDAKVNSLNTIEDILADYGGEKAIEATTTAATATAIVEEEEEEMFEAPLEMLDDDFDEYSEDDTPKKKRRYKRKTHSDEEKPKPTRRSSSDKHHQTKRKKSSDGANSFRRCAHTILKREGRPLSAAEIVKIGIKEGMISTTGKTPQNTLASVLYCEMKKDPRCVFVKVAPMTFGLRTWGGNHENYAEATEPVKTRGNAKRRRKKPVEESEESEESDMTPSEEEESAEQPIIINLSSVPAEK